jgi:hypothetical protein
LELLLKFPELLILSLQNGLNNLSKGQREPEGLLFKFSSNLFHKVLFEFFNWTCDDYIPPETAHRPNNVDGKARVIGGQSTA